jgi:hypothetical protein
MPFGDTPGAAAGRGREDFMMPQGALITSALSNKGNPTGFGQDNTFRVLDQQAIRLVDNKGNLLFSGVGPEAAKQAVTMGQGISNEKGNKAGWSIQTGDQYVNTDGTVGTRWSDVAREKKNTSPVGTILDIGLPILANALLPGSGFLGQALGKVGATMAASALGSAASGTLQGKSIGDIAKSAGLSAATAGILKGTPIGGYLDKAVSAVPVVGDVAKGLSKVVGSIPAIGGSTTGALTNALADDIVVSALRPVTSSLVGGALSTSLANSIANKYPAYQPTTQSSLMQSPTEAPYIDPLSDLTVTGTRLPNVSSFAVNPLTQNLIDQYAAKPTTQPAEQRTDNTDASEDIVLTGGRNPNLPFVAPTTKLFNNAQYSGGENVRDTQTADQEEQFKDGEEIIVTGRDKLPITFPFGSLDKSIKDFAVDKYGKFEPTDQVIEKDPVTGEDEIIVTGRNNNFLLPGVAGALATATKPEFTQDLTEAPKKTDLDKIIDYMRLAGLGVGLLGNIGGGGGRGSAGRYSSKNALNPIFSAKLPTAGAEGSFTVGGLGGTAADRTLAARPVTDWYRYGMGPAMDIRAGTDLSGATSPYAGYGPGTLGEETFRAVSGIPEKPVGMSHGGDMGYSRGSSRESFLVEGPGDGRSDDIPAMLSDGEYVVDAESLALLGNGSPKDGAKKMDEFRINLRKHKGKNLAMGKFSAKAKRLEAYMSGGRI